MRPFGRFCLVFFLFGAVCAPVTGRLLAAQLVRGPYLQAGNPDCITVRWRTDVPTESVVLYGTHSSDFPPAIDLTLATEHIVRLSGLVPATKYFYSIGSRTEILAQGPLCQFVTAPQTGQPVATRIWALGDSGALAFGETNVLAVRDAYSAFTRTRRTDVWLLLGDIAYEDGTDQEFQENFFDAFSSTLRQVAPWPAIGNHETYSATTSGWFPYLSIFSCPTNAECGGLASDTRCYYSFDYANIHFVSLDAMTQSRATNGPMANWLRRDLDANTNQWLIAFWHHPPYSKGSHDSDGEIEMIEMRQNIVPILEAHGADLVLCGHSHNYERSYLLHGHYGLSTTLQPSMIFDQGSGREQETGAYIKQTAGPEANHGTVYVVAGCADDLEPPIGHHPAMFIDRLAFGSVVVDVNSNRLDSYFVTSSGDVADSFTIIKAAPEPLRFTSFSVQNGSAIAQWPSIRGATYHVERTDNLETPDWQPEGSPMAATAIRTLWTNAVSSGGPAGYYRVVQESP